jgi:biopolymer transport protein ExbB/TolQ
MFQDFDWMGAIRTSPILNIIILCSVLTLGFALERAFYYWKRRGNPDATLSSAMVAIRSGNATEAARVLGAEASPMGYVGSVLLKHAEADSESVEERMGIALSEERLKLERNLSFLGTMGNTAPLLGLLGTVWGIMRAFHDMGRTGSAGPSVVAAGIAEALLTTAAGLLVAVPAVMIYNHYVRRMGVMLTTAENHTRTLRIEVQKARSHSGSARAAA